MLFHRQCEMVKYRQLPVVIHCREDNTQPGRALNDLLVKMSILETYPIMFHCFIGTTADVVLIKNRFQNVVFSFGGKIMQLIHQEWHNRVHTEREIWEHHGAVLQQTMRSMKLYSIVIETDAPFLEPPGFTRPIHSWLIGEIAFFIGHQNNLAPSISLELTWRNVPVDSPTCQSNDY